MLRWSAKGGVLALSRATRAPFRLRSGVGANDSVTLIDVATRRAARSRFRGVPSPLADSDAFLISGEQSAVVIANGALLGDCAVEGESGASSRAFGLVALAPNAVCSLAEAKLRRFPGQLPASSPGTRTAFFPGTAQLYVAQRETIAAWDARTGGAVEERRFAERASQLLSSNDGQRLVVLTQDDELLVYGPGATGGVSLGKLPGWSFELSASGKWLWSSHAKGATLLDLTSHERREVALERREFSREVDAAVGLDRKSKPPRLGVWRAGRAVRYLKLEPDAAPEHWAISDRAERVAVADGRQLGVFDVASGKLVRALSTQAAILELAFRPGTLELAVATENGVELWGDGDNTEHLADAIVEPSTWSIVPSPSTDAIAVHVGGEIVGFSLLDGAARPRRLADAPSTGSYAGLIWLRDGQPAAQNDGDPRLSPDGRFEVALGGRGGHLRRAGSTEALSLAIPPVDSPEASPSLQGVAFSSDGRKVLGFGSLNLPRNGTYRVTEWSTTDGSVLWSHDAELVRAAEPTRDGWVIEADGAVTRYEGHEPVFSERAQRGRTVYGYSAGTDLLGVIRQKALVLVDAVGKQRALALPFDEEVTGIVFDESGRRVALGTTLGLRVLSVEDGSELSSTVLGTRVEPLRWHNELLVAVRLSETASPEQAIFLLDTQSGADLSVGFARVKGGAVQSYALASNGLVDGAPEILAALRGGETGDVPVPAECARTGLLKDWLRAVSR